MNWDNFWVDNLFEARIYLNKVIASGDDSKLPTMFTPLENSTQQTKQEVQRNKYLKQRTHRIQHHRTKEVYWDTKRHKSGCHPWLHRQPDKMVCKWLPKPTSANNNLAHHRLQKHRQILPTIKEHCGAPQDHQMWSSFPQPWELNQPIAHDWSSIC